MEKQKKVESVQWSRANHSIFECFALELQEFTETGVLPAHADQDMRYCLELQRERLENKNLKMRYEFVPRGLLADNDSGRSWQDERYCSRMEFRTCTTNKEFYQGDKQLYQKKKKDTFYQTITNAKNMDVVGTELYACPNCDASSQVKVLQEGCPYCGTYFKISELFPKVTTFYFLDDISATPRELMKGVSKFTIPITIFFFAFYMLGSMQLVESNIGRILATIGSAVASIIGGFLIGYFLWALSLAGKVFFKAGESLPMLFDTAGSSKRFVMQMQKYSGEFSYEYFCNKVVSMLKMIIFSEDAKELPIYVGEPLGDRFENIVDANYVGATAMKGFQVQGDYCYVTVGVYMENLYEKKGSIISKKETVIVKLRKNIKKTMNYHFSIRNIQCKSCNHSFDATKQRTCPGCGTRYEIDDEDWVILSITT